MEIYDQLERLPLYTRCLSFVFALVVSLKTYFHKEEVNPSECYGRHLKAPECSGPTIPVIFTRSQISTNQAARKIYAGREAMEVPWRWSTRMPQRFNAGASVSEMERFYRNFSA